MSSLDALDTREYRDMLIMHRYSCCCLDGQEGPCEPAPSRCADLDCPCLEAAALSAEISVRAGAIRWGLPFYSYAVRVSDPDEGAEVYDVIAVDQGHAARQAKEAFGGLKEESAERFQVKVLHGPIF